jgi:ribosomal protein S18 acetylase RimI-like enzyme
VRAFVVPAYREPVPIEYVSRFPVDDALLSALHARAFGDGAETMTPWAARLRRHALTWIGAVDAGRLVGFVQVCWDGGEHAFLLDTAVEPEWQRRGVGAGLVAAAVADTAAAGCTWLHVDFEDRLSAFYLDRCGFRPTAAGLLRLT